MPRFLQLGLATAIVIAVGTPPVQAAPKMTAQQQTARAVEIQRLEKSLAALLDAQNKANANFFAIEGELSNALNRIDAINARADALATLISIYQAVVKGTRAALQALARDQIVSSILPADPTAPSSVAASVNRGMFWLSIGRFTTAREELAQEYGYVENARITCQYQYARRIADVRAAINSLRK